MELNGARTLEMEGDVDNLVDFQEQRLGNTMLSVWDVVAVGFYLALVCAAGILSLFLGNRKTVTGYFLAGRLITWLPVGASLFASNIGSEHFIGLAGSGAAAGVAVGAFELNALLLLQLLGWVFLPVFIASKVTTLPEYMSKRFGGRRIRTCLALFSIMLYIFTKISVNMYSGAIFLQQALRLQNIYTCIVVLLLLTAICTAVGGLAVVIYTDTLQFFVMIGGSTVLAVIALNKVGGLQSLYTSYLQAIPTPLMNGTSCGLPRKDSWVMLRSADTSVSDMPWPGFILGQTPASIWYWCADQMMVQRAMASKSLSHAKGATLFAGIFKLLPLFLIVIPGMVSRVLYTDTVACVDPEACYRFCGSRVSCTNSAYPKLVLELLPGGLRGVMLAVMLSALISDLTSIFNSAATLFTVDLWRYFRPTATTKEQLMCARLFILCLLGVSVAWVPVIESIQGGEMYIYIQSVAAYLSPPIAAVYCMALLYSRMNEAGAFWGLMCGFVVGSVRMILDFYYTEPLCYEEDTRPFIVQVHYMYFATLLFWLTATVSLSVSLTTRPVEPWRLIRATFWLRWSMDEREDEQDLDEAPEVEAKRGRSELHDQLSSTEPDDPTGPLSLETAPINGQAAKEVNKKQQLLGAKSCPSKCKLFVVKLIGTQNAKSTKLKTKSCTMEATSDDEERELHPSAVPLHIIESVVSNNSHEKVLLGSPDQEDPEQQLQEAAKRHEDKLLSTLHQEPWENRLLNSLLVVICVLCLVLYVVFSINPFTEEQVKQLQAERLLEMGLANVTSIYA
uniref:Sodium/myo-inositol cotransporter-like n=2 Tax=Hirondellea gigas TaxID=1518452 RepID=A0A2P2HZC4_9CRUS